MEESHMNNKILIIAICLSAALLFAGIGHAAEVSQGKCIEYDQTNHKIILEEYDTNITSEAPYGNSTGIVSNLDVTKAAIGITPEPGDILRVAYKVDGNKKLALKVMNVSKQDIMKK